MKRLIVAALAGRVPAFEQHHLAAARRLQPVLHLDQLDLQQSLLSLVLGVGHPLVVGVRLPPGVHDLAVHRAKDRVVVVEFLDHEVPGAVALLQFLQLLRQSAHGIRSTARGQLGPIRTGRGKAGGRYGEGAMPSVASVNDFSTRESPTHRSTIMTSTLSAPPATASTSRPCSRPSTPFKGQPEIAAFQFRASNEWVSGTHNRSTIQGFYGAGQEDTEPDRARSPTTPTTRPCWWATTTARPRSSSCCTRSPPA